MSADPQPRSSNAGILLLVLFAGFEVVQAIAQHDPTQLFGTWLALTAALALAMRMPATRAELTRRDRLRSVLVGTEASWLGLIAAATVVAVVAGRPSSLIWAGAGALCALLTPVAVSAGIDSDT